MTILFAIFYMILAVRRPECIHVNGVQYGEDSTGFFQNLSDAFALSWTTFSTVGYGLVYPSVSSIHAEQARCAGVTIVCTLESFVGILFASFCGAVMFGKVARIRSHAQVIFSDVMVVRFGAGVMPEEFQDQDADADVDVDDASSLASGMSRLSNDEETAFNASTPQVKLELPCPVLEFRIVNRLNSAFGGEIIDATLNIVASIDESQASSSLKKAARAPRRKGKPTKVRRTKKKMGTGPAMNSPGLNMISSSIPEGRTTSSKEQQHETFHSIAEAIRAHARSAHQAFDEDPSGKIVPRRIFSKLEIESPDHPFFKRVWIARHTLDENSPLLTEEAKKIVRMNEGFWPEELNDHEAVRASIQFDQILVSLSGTSNVDASSVYAQKGYHYDEMNVGYSFVSLLYNQGPEGHLAVDPTKINDVVEQYGGGGEPLFVAEKRGFGDMLVL
eukprot:CAMPEP_0116860338 /NCGR_PEP_ID=MMETSP0418-20121206/22353_1 /TAXON_ID=1158023 /ORGANISM="Astrosyne radiata, Strain 13vi08-1A" /LENGTH=445 /DNA_ID=CAMNT_0004494721 /DNA_START=334 /DNA_END=1671 /DNA_ORIENTATION=-